MFSIIDSESLADVRLVNRASFLSLSSIEYIQFTVVSVSVSVQIVKNGISLIELDNFRTFLGSSLDFPIQHNSSRFASKLLSILFKFVKLMFKSGKNKCGPIKSLHDFSPENS